MSVEKIKQRTELKKTLEKLAAENGRNFDLNYVMSAILFISDSLDDYIEHRIFADKTIEGILKDIANNTDRIASQNAD